MTFAQHHPGAPRGEWLQRAVLVVCAVARAVAIKGDGIVGSINHREMDEFTGFGGFDRAAEVLGATEKIAAGNPPGRLPFAEHD